MVVCTYFSYSLSTVKIYNWRNTALLPNFILCLLNEEFFVNFQVIRIPETSDETFNNLLAFGKAMGKTTVNCKVIRLYLTITSKQNKQGPVVQN